MTQTQFNKFEFALLMAFASLSLVGCGKIDLSSTLLHAPVPVSAASHAQGVEVVSGSTIGQKTLLNGYTVDASVGPIFDKLETKTPNGYTVYNGVKGDVVSENH